MSSKIKSWWLRNMCRMSACMRASCIKTWLVDTKSRRSRPSDNFWEKKGTLPDHHLVGEPGHHVLRVLHKFDAQSFTSAGHRTSKTAVLWCLCVGRHRPCWCTCPHNCHVLLELPDMKHHISITIMHDAKQPHLEQGTN